MKYIKNFFFNHTNQQGTTYRAHLRFGLHAGLKLIGAGLASIVHAIVPAWFPNYSEQTCKDLLKQNELRNKK